MPPRGTGRISIDFANEHFRRTASPRSKGAGTIMANNQQMERNDPAQPQKSLATGADARLAST
jgi:hypothetical protein